MVPAAQNRSSSMQEMNLPDLNNSKEKNHALGEIISIRHSGYYRSSFAKNYKVVQMSISFSSTRHLSFKHTVDINFFLPNFDGQHYGDES